MSMSPPTDARRGRRSRRCDFQVQGGIAGSHNAKRSSRGNYHELELQLPGWWWSWWWTWRWSPGWGKARDL